MAERTNHKLAQWYHATLFSPVKHTIIQAIKKGYLYTWPNLKRKIINKHLTPSMEKSRYHIHQTRKKFKSTNPKYPKKPEEKPTKPLVQRTNTVFTNIIDHTRQISTDLTVKSPVTSNRGNKYIFVLYYYDRNCILIHPMK